MRGVAAWIVVVGQNDHIKTTLLKKCPISSSDPEALSTDREVCESVLHAFPWCSGCSCRHSTTAHAHAHAPRSSIKLQCSSVRCLSHPYSGPTQYAATFANIINRKLKSTASSSKSTNNYKQTDVTIKKTILYNTAYVRVMICRFCDCSGR